jgi:Putative metallopeptidase
MKTLSSVPSLLLSLFLGQLAFALPPGSSAVNGYPTLDANRVYTPGQKVKIDEPHGVYTGVIAMDDYYFLNPLVLGDSQRKDEGPGAFAISGSMAAEIRQATSSTWQKITVSYVCDNREFRIDQVELARTPNKTEAIVGDHGSVCSLKQLSGSEAEALLNTRVQVEPWQTLVRDTVTVNPGQALRYNFTLDAGTRLLAQFKVQGGLDNQLQVFVMDPANFENYTANRPFHYYHGSSGTVRGIAKSEFEVPQTGVYYILLDNGKAWLLQRNVTLHLDAILPKSTPESEQMRKGLDTVYANLKGIFIFTDFQTTVRHCGTANAFSNPNITLCIELIEELTSKNMQNALLFVYLHELGHTLMREWGFPLWDNEDAADEFATAFLLVGKQQQFAMQAAQWWASEGATTQDAVAKIWMDDRHSLSPQRARNILHWVNNASELVPRWEHVFVPNMQTAALEEMLRDPEVSDKDFVKSELSRRSTSAKK